MDVEDAARKKSAFRKARLHGAENEKAERVGCGLLSPPTRRERPQSVRFRSKDEVYTIARPEDEESDDERFMRFLNASAPPLGPLRSPLPDGSHSTMYRFGALLLLLAGVFPLLHNLGLLSHGSLGIQGVSGGPIPDEARSGSTPVLVRRQDSPIDVCFRWAQQSALVNGTLYLYGGQASTEAGQTQNTWNNNLLTLDLTRTWQIGSPRLEGLPQPSGPPEVALGYLFNDLDSLYLYGGQFSWQPPVSPVPFVTWEYNIPSESWIEHGDPVTSGGNSAPSNGEDVERSSEGAGVNIPTLGRGYYFGGHQDGYTTPDWSQSIWRIYLQSMLEYTFPGYTNNQVDSLGDGQTAGDDGVYRNITNGGLQAQAGFTARADGILAYVPGYGKEGILLALAGGTNETFTQMNNVNVYDIATSSWYTQATAGETPDIRVNPCSVVAASQDGTSHNVYMWGGQNLIPAGNQTQFDDMWILSIPSFNWIRVDQSGQSVPYGRSGHTCNIWNGQLVSVGGYVGDQLTCESPGIYVFDLSTLEWKQEYTALSSGVDDGSDNGGSFGSSDKSGSTGSNNPFNQQPAQIAHDGDPGGLYGSYGYEVPEAVYNVIGGGKTGGATITEPAATATAGPMATGSAHTYTVTRPDGSTITETSTPKSGSGSSSSSSSSSSGGGGPNIAAIVVGTVCGVLLIIIAYLLFCLYLYRKQLALYQQHVEMSQRQARGEKLPAIPGLWTTTSESGKSSGDRRRPEGQPFLALESGSQGRSSGPASSGPGRSGGGAAGAQSSSVEQGTTSSARSSTEDLLSGQEPTFVGVLLNPRRSLKVVNRD